MPRWTSLACWELLEEQPDHVQDEVLPPRCPLLSVEAGVSLGWDRWADDSVAIERFGVGPGQRVLDELGFTPEHVAERAQVLLRDLEGPE